VRLRRRSRNHTARARVPRLAVDGTVGDPPPAREAALRLVRKLVSARPIRGILPLLPRAFHEELPLSRIAFAAGALALAAALPAHAQFAKPEDAIRYRQGVMFAQNFHLGRIFAMANGRMPFDAKVVQADAAVLDVIDKLPFAAFGPGTDKGANTNAKAEVWTERAKFDAAAQKMQDNVAKLNVAAQSGNIDQIKAAVGAVGQSCKACHDVYQKQ
jgi:cytochrome c556